MTLQEFATSFSNRKNVKNVGGKKTQGLHPETIKQNKIEETKKTKKSYIIVTRSKSFSEIDFWSGWSEGEKKGVYILLNGTKH